jgi:hypothetical protein
MAGEHDRQGSGRHPHKDAQEPWPHTKEEDRREGEHRARSEHGRKHQSSASHRGGAQAHGERAEEADLRRREYRDEKGEVHHHTKTYMEQHGKK